MVGINEVLGYRYRFTSVLGQLRLHGDCSGLLGRNHPAGVLVAALPFGVQAVVFLSTFSSMSEGTSCRSCRRS
jgi:ABC-type uncharacterized transport system permease subunit